MFVYNSCKCSRFLQKLNLKVGGIRKLRKTKEWKTLIAFLNEEAANHNCRDGIDAFVLDSRLQQVLKYRRRKTGNYVGDFGGLFFFSSLSFSSCLSFCFFLGCHSC